MMRLTAILIVLLTGFGRNAAGGEASGPSLEGTVGGQFHYGPVDGFLQTPAGGEPGTSSHRRPTLDELDIHDAVFYDVLGSLQWRRLRLYAGYEAIDLEGDAELSQSLVSHGVTFPAGSHVRSDTEWNWLRAGAGWKLDFAERRLEFVPKAEYALLDFKYDLSGGGQSADRSYTKGCFRLGLESRYHFTRVIGLSLIAEGSVPLSNTPQIAVLEGGVEFNLWPGNRRVHPKVFLGGGAQRIEYEDDQDLPNHFKVDLGPFVTGGLAISF